METIDQIATSRTITSGKQPTAAAASLPLFMLLLASIVFVGHFLYFRYAFPSGNVDEASFFSPALNLAERGQLSSDIHASFFPGADAYTYWMPPLYMVLLGGVFKLFGATVLHAKLLSFVLTAAAALLLCQMARGNNQKMILASLLLLCPFVIISSGFIRMEALGVLMTVLAIVAVYKQCRPALLGVLAGLGVLVHPMMGACAVALGLYCLLQGWRSLLLFGIAALLTMSPYLWYIGQNYELFQVQMKAQLVRKASQKLNDLKAEYVLQVVPFAMVGFYCLWLVKERMQMRIFLAVGMLLALLLVLKSDEFNYQVYVMPYFLGAIALVLAQERQTLVTRLLPLIVFVAFGGLLWAKGAKQQFRNDTTYVEMLRFLEANNEWKGKKIYVLGVPDVATWLMQQQQRVERKNAVASIEQPGWFNKFDCVIGVVHDKKSRERYEKGPWIGWRNHKQMTTTDGSYTLHLLTPELAQVPALK